MPLAPRQCGRPAPRWRSFWPGAKKVLKRACSDDFPWHRPPGKVATTNEKVILISIPWQDIAYLASGNQRQRRAYRALERLQVLNVLRDYTPVLVGTVPIAIDIGTSDLDVICEVHELDVFERLVVQTFGQQEGFRIKRKQINALPVSVANFEAEFPIEIFGQPRPVREQNAYRHMDVQSRLLALGGDEARREIVRLKRAGLKTEPAFARYFGIQGEPFEALLALSRLDEQELRGRIENSHHDHWLTTKNENGL